MRNVWKIIKAWFVKDRGPQTLAQKLDVSKAEVVGAAMYDLGFDGPMQMAMPRHLWVAFDGFALWPLKSHCGKECLKILRAACPLLDVSDKASHKEVWSGIVAAMAVICHG